LSITPAELALIRLRPGESLPSDGASAVATYNKEGKPRTGSSYVHADVFNPLFQARCGVQLVRGSFNLWTKGAAPLGEPARLPEGEFWPIILEEQAVGVVFRRGNAVPDFLEVFSPVSLKDRLKAEDGMQVNVRLLPGTLLCL
jgi:hypothetical protein